MAPQCLLRWSFAQAPYSLENLLSSESPSNMGSCSSLGIQTSKEQLSGMLGLRISLCFRSSVAANLASKSMGDLSLAVTRTRLIRSSQIAQHYFRTRFCALFIRDGDESGSRLAVATSFPHLWRARRAKQRSQP